MPESVLLAFATIGLLTWLTIGTWRYENDQRKQREMKDRYDDET